MRGRDLSLTLRLRCRVGGFCRRCGLDLPTIGLRRIGVSNVAFCRTYIELTNYAEDDKQPSPGSTQRNPRRVIWFRRSLHKKPYQ
jgi:hypothetical protein